MSPPDFRSSSGMVFYMLLMNDQRIKTYADYCDWLRGRSLKKQPKAAEHLPANADDEAAGE